ncbi:MAG: hypothetical protein EKK64_07295 [Neisseriaceae bacterium]|nr:MAG: hypothetical protein EKK64_07295 [Neisseriaceae bacterium]
MILKKLFIGLLGLVAVQAYADVYVDGNIGLNTTYGAFAWNVDGGYMINKNLGLEGGLTYSSGSYYWNSDYWMFDGAVKGVLPLSDVFALYGKAGLALNSYTGEYSNANLGILLGVGAQFNLDRYWTLHVEDYASTGYANPNFLMFGGQYNF